MTDASIPGAGSSVEAHDGPARPPTVDGCERPEGESDRTGGSPRTAVPAGETPRVCPYCERPFRRERLYDLHVGETHATVATDAERAAYETAHEAESDELFVYHLKVVAAIVMLLMGLAYLYAFVLA